MNAHVLPRTNPALVSRRQLLLATGAVATSGTALAAPATLPFSESLQAELAAALKNGQPLLVMVSLDGCPFCKVARQNYLGPMYEQQGLPIVQIDRRSVRPVLDFKGRLHTHDALARGWGVKVTPTVLFFGRGGAEVAERLVGGYLPDFYGTYLEDRLVQSRAAVRK